MKDQPYDTIIQRIKLHLDPKKKVIPQRCRFLKRIQQEGESISEYLRELKHLAINCNFVDMLGTMMRDRFVAGIKLESLQKKLLQEDDDVTLDKVLQCTANKAIELDRYPIPSIDEIFLKLSTSTVISTLDLSQAYLPYDVAVAPNRFQRIMEGLFSDLPASRIKRWSLKLAAFNYTEEFRKGSDNSNVDTLSRLPLESSVREFLDEDQVLLLRKLNEVPFSFREVAYETSRDKILSIVLRNVREGNCVCIDSNIKELTRECRVCQESASMPPATISEWTWPEKPWHRLHLDLAEVTSGNKEETASVHIPSCTPIPGPVAVHVPSCTPKPEAAAVQVPVRSPRPQRARKPLDRLDIKALRSTLVAAKFVPKLLNCDQKQHRMNIANEMLDSVRDDPNLLQRVITGDEAWVYGYDVEIKAQSSQWKLPHEPKPKKARQVRSNVKVLLTVFFDCRGVVHHEFLPQGRTVNYLKRNITCELSAIHAKQSARNARICGSTKIVFCTTITPLLTHRCLMVEIRSGNMQEMSEERIKAEEPAKPQTGAKIGRDASADPVVLNPNIYLPRNNGTKDW
ncbi:hypothetical protein LAZ67_X004272 [Cordylochernes scorpioides]|uniref:Retrotransposon gag domain-containing protein n=1 Tax=Cordylochernes scorpioides TaxID=51811 RepID=A0ABY6LUV0_9ARAC|nr:hypothetical protein LAZ67_X004272 [Cordylochernes scorpioides]